MPAVSVIMGIHNSSNKDILLKAINSILDQCFTDFEFIICDDGSEDDTYKYLVSLCESDKRIILIKNSMNLGLASTLNNCFRIAKGKYIARMDADDISEKTRFEKQVKFLDENEEYALVGCNTNLINNDGIWGQRRMLEAPIKKDFLFNSPFVHPSIMIRKNALEKLNGYRVAKETLRCEDYDLFMRLYTLGMKGYNINETLFNYREDNVNYHRRKYKFRIDEAIIRYKGFKELGLFPLGFIFVIKPLIVGFLPVKFLKFIKKERV